MNDPNFNHVVSSAATVSENIFVRTVCLQFSREQRLHASAESGHECLRVEETAWTDYTVEDMVAVC